MEIRELIKRSLAALPQLAAESDSKQIKADIDMLLGVTLRLTAELANRNAALAKQHRSRKAKPPKASPQRGPKQPKNQPSSTDTPKSQNGAEDQPQTLSRIQQGIRQADSSLADQQRALRQQIYGQQNRDVAFAKAAKAIAS